MVTLKKAIIDSDNFEYIVRPKNIFEEVQQIVLMISSEFDLSLVTSAYQDIVKLFNGEFFGYQKCNTQYHDLRHTEDCMLEIARLIHGAIVNNYKLENKYINLGLISAILHDTGYIQLSNDTNGTGAKYTLTHIERSIKFAKNYFEIKGYSINDYIFVKNCLKCTGLNVQLKDIQFDSLENELIGKMLGTADLIGQMADINYLQKLPYLFKEFQEGGIKHYKTDFDLLKNTNNFWRAVQYRFQTELGNVDRFLRDHFWIRWGIDRDLDREAIENNISYLNFILENYPDDYHRYLENSTIKLHSQ